MAFTKILKPGRGHPITVTKNPGRVTVSVGGQVIADTRQALTLREASYPAVQYIPREDADLSALRRTEHQTYCPFKGESSYYSVQAGGQILENAVWTYEQPYDAVAGIKDHLAFYPGQVQIAEQPA